MKKLEHHRTFWLALAASLWVWWLLRQVDRWHGYLYMVVRASPSAIQLGKGAGHQGTDAGTVFEEVSLPFAPAGPVDGAAQKFPEHGL